MDVRERLAELIDAQPVDPESPHSPTVQRALGLARVLQARGLELQTPEEKRQQRELEKMVESAEDKATMTQMTDQAFRAHTPRRVADQLTHILDVQGVPRFFSTLDRTLLKGFQSFGNYLPGVAVPLVKEKMRDETANVILPAEPDLLAPHLAERRESRVRMNVNFLGEALLGEEDAQHRLQTYLAALQMPEIEVISVKATTIYSQITPISFEHSVETLCDRLERLYRAAVKSTYEQLDGEVTRKFVYLDMEEYRDLWVTVEAFIRTLSRPGLEQARAGIALQAYIPDSFDAQQRINAWARGRVKSGGAPVTIRLVKGANMEMERVEASVAGWPQAPYNRKVDTDANFKRMLHEALEAENAAAVRLGVASHNVFEVAYALVLVHERDLYDQVQFEMLEGMVNHQRRALGEVASNILLYAPATKKEDFVNAIGYLIRRLDENTGPENFLRHAFKVKAGDEAWNRLEQLFLESHRLAGELSTGSRRTQDRREEPAPWGLVPLEAFDNEPDTDFSLPANQRWAQGIVEAWRDRKDEAATVVPIVVAGEVITGGRELRERHDPSRPHVVVRRALYANLEDVDQALACAANDPTGWRDMPSDERAEVLADAAHELRKARGDLMGAAMAEAGKLFAESDPEVSEAIDFVMFYCATARALASMPSLEAKPKGAVAVIPPWNFPIAIPCGGVAAALATGNTVIIKPAPETVLTAYILCEAFWRAGVPKEVLQFVPTEESTGGSRIVTSEAVDVVILTGGTDTALKLVGMRPEMNLLAETGGKNATIVTSMSDREMAIKHLLHSAFSHGGQKCSATSLLILEGEVYDDPTFKETLCDAVRSLRVGSAWSLDTKLGPLVTVPAGHLERGLKDLEDGESWAVMPRMVDGNPHLWSPAVKWGVQAGSYTHMTEFFGPVLAVMRAENLDDAIRMVNATGYGLTSGIESLDDREVELWRESVLAGNLYINRVTTGAVVYRQPFGGMGKSAFGPGIKAGGPSYVAQLCDWSDAGEDVEPPDRAVRSPEVEVLRKALRRELGRDEGVISHHELRRILRAIDSYDRRFVEVFTGEDDAFRLVGQDNLRRYLPVKWLRVRIASEDTAFDIFARVCAAKTVGATITVSHAPDTQPPGLELLDGLTEWWGASIEFVEETDAELADVIGRHDTDRVRYAGELIPQKVLAAVGDTGIYVARAPVLEEGRIELLWYLREQSISHDYHRYGNLGSRVDETRRNVT